MLLEKSSSPTIGVPPVTLVAPPPYTRTHAGVDSDSEHSNVRRQRSIGLLTTSSPPQSVVPPEEFIADEKAALKAEWDALASRPNDSAPAAMSDDVGSSVSARLAEPRPDARILFFKFGDRTVAVARASTYADAEVTARETFSISKRHSITLCCNYPGIGMAELTSGSWDAISGEVSLIIINTNSRKTKERSSRGEREKHRHPRMDGKRTHLVPGALSTTAVDSSDDSHSPAPDLLLRPSLALKPFQNDSQSVASSSTSPPFCRFTSPPSIVNPFPSAQLVPWDTREPMSGRWLLIYTKSESSSQFDEKALSLKSWALARDDAIENASVDELKRVVASQVDFGLDAEAEKVGFVYGFTSSADRICDRRTRKLKLDAHGYKDVRCEQAFEHHDVSGKEKLRTLFAKGPYGFNIHIHR